MNPPIIQLKQVDFSYNGPLILKNIDLEIQRNEFLGLVGPNGGGKSTLLKLILGLLQPMNGQVSVLGRSPQESRRSIGYVPQFADFQKDFPISVTETVLLGRLGTTSWLGGYRRQDRKIAHQVMAQTHLLPLAKRSLATLSGGQLQRVLIARALACEPEILILDEPTANIDLRGEEDIFDLLKNLNPQPTILVVSHDIGFISRYVNRVACLNQTLVCHQTDALNGRTIQQLYEGQVRMIHHLH